MNEKMKILEQTEHVFGKKVDIEEQTLEALYKINQQLVDVRYKKSLGKMSPNSLNTHSKQCFVVNQDPKSKKIVETAVDLIDHDICMSFFDGKRIKQKIMIKIFKKLFN